MITLIVGIFVFCVWSALSTRIFNNRIKGPIKKYVKVEAETVRDKDSANKKTVTDLK